MIAKLRQDLDYLPLARFCDVSEGTAHNIFVTWVNFCSRQWSEIDMWGGKDLVQFYSPADFMLKFPTTRVIVDGTEIPIQKPANPVAQRATFSSYKNRNTVKVVVGSSPAGLKSYLSPAYGGATSDRQIIERSGLPTMCDAGDSVMADKGFNVQDLFAVRDVLVNISTFFKKKNRLSGNQVIADRKIYSKRVHIERTIGLM
jgi:DDE superfamily endonuclease